MAKRKPRDVQKRIPGTFDKPIKALQDKAEEYADALRERMEMQEAENQLRQELIDLMKKHDRQTCNLDGQVVVAGLNTYIEVWSTAAWDEEREQVEGAEVDIDGWAALGI